MNSFSLKNFIKISKRSFCSAEEFPVPKFKTNIMNDLATAKKQVFWRIRNIGQLELEFCLMKWYETQNMNLEQLKKFSTEVLEMENPDMNKYFVKLVEPPQNYEFTQQIQKFLRG